MSDDLDLPSTLAYLLPSEDDMDVFDETGKYIVRLNHKWVVDRKISYSHLVLIKKTHVKKHRVFTLMHEALKDKNAELLSVLVKSYRDIEIYLQGLWAFDQDDDYHFWSDIPGCTCSRLSIEEIKSNKPRLYKKNCPIHHGRHDPDMLFLDIPLQKEIKRPDENESSNAVYNGIKWCQSHFPEGSFGSNKVWNIEIHMDQMRFYFYGENAYSNAVRFKLSFGKDCK